MTGFILYVQSVRKYNKITLVKTDPFIDSLENPVIEVLGLGLSPLIRNTGNLLQCPKNQR